MTAMRCLPWILATALVLLFAQPIALGQSDDDETPPAAEEPAAEDDDNGRDPLIREGVFKPSEEIEADSEISFPADI